DLSLATFKAGANARGLHTRWHVQRGVKKDDCIFCHPPVEATELLESIRETLAELPTPQPPRPVEEVTPEPQTPEDDGPITSTGQRSVPQVQVNKFAREEPR